VGNSKIEWTEKTWNPITGCTPISEGCQNCYAARMAKRLAGRYGYPRHNPFKPGTLHVDKMEEPLRWRKPSRIFVCSMGDLFHKNVSYARILDVCSVVRKAPQHTFIILTKRPDIMKHYTEYLWHSWNMDSWPANCWLGVTTENQQRADERIPILLQIPAAVRFVSVEPMLGPVDLSLWMVSGYEEPPYDDVINWVIAGGETGPGARPMHPDWVKGLRDQCASARVPFFFKSWGEWTNNYPQGTSLACRDMAYRHDTTFYNVGKNKAGRLLDNREWNEYPEGSNNE
jgi:protein gp37